MQIIGGRERQINVWVDPDKMRVLNISPVEVMGGLRVQNQEFPGERAKSQEQLMIDAGNLVAEKYPKDLRTAVQQVQAFSGGGFRNANVQFFIGGPDLKNLGGYLNKLVEVLKNSPDAVHGDSALIGGKPELQLTVDREKAADFGVRVGDVSPALNILVAGQEATNFNEGVEQYEAASAQMLIFVTMSKV